MIFTIHFGVPLFLETPSWMYGEDVFHGNLKRTHPLVAIRPPGNSRPYYQVVSKIVGNFSSHPKQIQPNSKAFYPMYCNQGV